MLQKLETGKVNGIGTISARMLKHTASAIVRTLMSRLLNSSTFQWPFQSGPGQSFSQISGLTLAVNSY